MVENRRILHTKSFCLATCSVFLLVFLFNPASVLSATPTAMTILDGMPTREEQETIMTLERDIEILDSEIAKCEYKKKGWIAATVIGGVGTVSTATAAIVQGVKISDQKKTISSQQTEMQNLQKEKTTLGIQ